MRQQLQATVFAVCVLALGLVRCDHSGVGADTTKAHYVERAVGGDAKHGSVFKQAAKLGPAQLPAVTVTQLVFAARDALETSAPGLKTCHSCVGSDPLTLTKGTAAGVDAHSEVHWWSMLILKPVHALKAMVMVLYSYVLAPAWMILLWNVRVLLFRPAVFIYLLFLERPFKAALSLFLWILPLLSFAVATTIVGTLIGGIFGWISAVTVGFVNAPAVNSTDQKVTWSARAPSPTSLTKRQMQTSLDVGYYKAESAPAENTLFAANNRLRSEPELWTRRRRSRSTYVASPTASSYTH